MDESHGGGLIDKHWRTVCTVVAWSVGSGLCWQEDLCLGDTYGISHKSPAISTQFACTSSGADRIGSDRFARTRARLLLSEKFLSVYFIADDRMIIALREFLINRDNFSRNR